MPLDNNPSITQCNMLSKYFGSSGVSNNNSDRIYNYDTKNITQPILSSSSSRRKMNTIESITKTIVNNNNNNNSNNNHHHHHHNHHHHHHHHHNWYSTIVNNNNTWSSITYNTLKTIPEYYPLNTQSYVIIKLDANNVLSNIIVNIKECLQKSSIVTIFDDKQAVAWCESEDHVRFTIRLFLASNNNEDDNIIYYNNNNIKETKKCILIETQRFDGCAIRFHTYSRFILNYRLNKIMKEENNNNTTIITSTKINKDEISIPKLPLQLLPTTATMDYYPNKNNKSKNKKEYNDNNNALLPLPLPLVSPILPKNKLSYSNTNDLDVVNNLFSKEDCIDSLLLGMESLRFCIGINNSARSSSLTDEELSMCAHAVLIGNNELYPHVHATIKKYLLLSSSSSLSSSSLSSSSQFNNNYNYSNSSSNDDEIRDEVENNNNSTNTNNYYHHYDATLDNRNIELLHNHSLAIITNSLYVLSNDEQFKLQFCYDAKQTQEQWLHGKELLHIFIDEIKKSYMCFHYLHDACLAVKALNIIFNLCPNMLKQEAARNDDDNNNDLKALLKDCRNIGLHYHELLACECQHALKNLEER